MRRPFFVKPQLLTCRCVLMALVPPSGGVNDACARGWRHEAQSVQAAVVSALHHSRGVGSAKHVAPRGQMKTTEEEAGLETHSGSRACRTGSSRVCPCQSWQTGRRMVWTPSGLAFLVRRAVEDKRKEEEEEEERKLAKWGLKPVPKGSSSFFPALSSSSKRKRKKWRKRRTPRTSFRSLCGRARRGMLAMLVSW